MTYSNIAISYLHSNSIDKMIAMSFDNDLIICIVRKASKEGAKLRLCARMQVNFRLLQQIKTVVYSRN